MKQMRDIKFGSLGVPVRRLAVALSASSPRCAAGFPLQSLTRNARATMASLVLAVILSSGCGSPPADPIAQQHRPALEMFPFWHVMERWDTSALGKEIDSLTIVLSSDSLNAPAYLRRGQLMIAAERRGYGLTDFDKAIRLDSTLAEAYFSRGVIRQYLASQLHPTTGCKDICHAVALGYHPPDDLPDLWTECLIEPWDTLKVDGQWKFVPLQAFLLFSTYDPVQRLLIKQSLVSKSLSIDSLWIDPSHQHSDTSLIQLDLLIHSGILEEMALSKTGTMRQGNWSGKDGTLTIDKTTGKSTYLLWQ
jgi:hypothetical protein